MRALSVVGRAEERLRLASVIEGARSGVGGCVAIVGAAGLGKSALVRSVVDSSHDAVVGRATPPPSPPLRCLSEIASGLLRRGGEPDDATLRVFRTALQALLPSDIAAGSGETPTPVHLGDALFRLSQTCGKRAPRVLVVEDVHWADDTTLGVIEYLADNAAALGIALVVTTRPEGDALSLVRRLAGRHSLDLIELHRLSPDEVNAMAVECLGSDPPAGLADALTRAEGVPLMVEEMLTSCEHGGALTRIETGWAFTASALRLPATVVENVGARLALLASDQRKVVEAAALLGREFDSGLLSSALALGDDAVHDALQQALTVGLLAPEPGTWRLHFSHALVRDAVLELASPSQRRAIAVELAGSLEQTLVDSHNVELAAALAAEAGQSTLAASLAERAGRDLMLRGLPHSAVASFERAIALEPLGPDALPRRQKLLEALALSGDADRADAQGVQLLRQLVASGAPLDAVEACHASMARAAANAGRWAEAEQRLRAATDDGSLPASSVAAMVALERGRFDDAERLAQVVLETSTDTASLCEVAEVLGRLARRRDLDEAKLWFERAAATAELNGSALWRARALHELATIDQLRSLAVDGLLRARDEAIAASAPGLLSAVDFHLAALHGVRFEPDEALAAARRCLDTARGLGAGRQQAWAWNLIGQAHAVRGDRIRATAASDEAIAQADDDPEVLGVAIGTGRGLASLLAEDRDRAFDEWRTAIEHLRKLPDRVPLPPWYLWPLLATVHDLEGDGGQRARTETDVRELRLGPGVDGLWHLASAVALGRDGDVTAARHEARTARQLFDRVPAFAGYVHLGTRLVAESAIGGGWGDPAAWLQDAGGWFSARGFTETTKACDALARRAGVPQRRAGRGDSAVTPALANLGVTSREVDVLVLLKEGLTNRDIAERLYVSPRTVKGHIENLLAKTGLANRTQLAGLLSREH